MVTSFAVVFLASCRASTGMPFLMLVDFINDSHLGNRGGCREISVDGKPAGRSLPRSVKR